MTLQKLRKDYTALTDDLSLLGTPDLENRQPIGVDASALWADMRQNIALSTKANTAGFEKTHRLKTRFAHELVRMVAITRYTSFMHAYPVAGHNACIEAEPAFVQTLLEAPEDGDVRPVLFEDEDGIEGVMKFDGERSILTFTNSNGVVEGGLYGVPTLASLDMKYDMAGYDGYAIIPTTELVKRTGALAPVRLSNFALDAEIRAHAAEALGKPVFGTMDMKAAADALAASDYAAAKKRGKKVLDNLISYL